MKNRSRNIKQEFYVNETEKELIKTKMEQYGTTNMSAYLRKIAIDGYVIKQDYTELKNVTFEMNKIGNNINQIAKKVNAYGSKNQDIEEVKGEIEKLWQLLSSKISKEI